MYVVTSAQMRSLDAETIDRLGIPAASLMENAGKAIAEEVLKLCRERGAGGESEGWTTGSWTTHPRTIDSWMGRTIPPSPGPIPNLPTQAAGYSRSEPQSFRLRDTYEAYYRTGAPIKGDTLLFPEQAMEEHWLILVGKGNNGGDGLVAARHLRDAGVRVTLLYAAEPAAIAGAAAFQRDAAAALGIPAMVHGADAVDMGAFTGIVDALLGTGASSAPRGAYAALIQAANESGLPIVSADIPSGLDTDTGALHEPCIRAAVTVCLAFLKRGLVQYPGAEAAGRVVLRAIGIPQSLCREQGVSTFLLTPEVLRSELDADPARRRDPVGHKGTYGHVLTAAGNRTMSGAGLLCSRAALRAGSGLVTWAVPESLLLPLVGAAPELMLVPGTEEVTDGVWNESSADRILELADSRDVLVIGPGMGRFDGDTRWLRRIWEGWHGPLVVDADALNMLAAADDANTWRHRTADTVLTPHPGEMARIAGLSTPEVQRDRVTCATRYAARLGVTLVLKGARTVVASPDGRAYINTTGHAGMATGGSGDVLTGIIAGLLSQGHSGPAAAALGVWLHGLAGERAAYRRGHPSAIIASDIIEEL